jgi:hypothetical protein
LELLKGGIFGWIERGKWGSWGFNSPKRFLGLTEIFFFNPFSFTLFIKDCTKREAKNFQILNFPFSALNRSVPDF